MAGEVSRCGREVGRVWQGGLVDLERRLMGVADG